MYFRYLMMEATDGFLIVLNAADGQIIYASESVTSLLGYIPADLKQISLYELLCDEDKRYVLTGLATTNPMLIFL